VRGAAGAPEECVERVAVCGADELQRRFVSRSRPVLLTGLLAGWPAVQRWSLDYFETHHGDRRVLVGRLRDGRLEVSPRTGVEQREVPLGDFVRKLRAGDRSQYLISPVEDRIPALLDDVRLPEICTRARWRAQRLWLGGAGVRTPLHHDLPENLYAVVFGSKRIALVPRGERRNVYPNRRLSRAPNFSRVDAFAPDTTRFPRFKRVQPLVCEVGPGECLYIPRLWWHTVESLEPSASLSLWFANGFVAALAAASQAYARLRQLRP
jgi:hypothetical protein